MEDLKQELEQAIKRINECITLLGDIDLYNYNSVSTRHKNQKKVIRTYNVLYSVKDRLTWYKEEKL